MIEIPKPITVKIIYNEELQKITGTTEDTSVMGDNTPFGFFLHCIFIEYPDIEKQYPPGVLCFSINGVAPEVDTVLCDGDQVSLWV